MTTVRAHTAGKVSLDCVRDGMGGIIHITNRREALTLQNRER
jgi:hypothetical protein